MSAKPYELLARFNKDGTIAGCHVRTIETINGKDYESEPMPLASATDSAFTAFASSFSAGIVIERDTLATDKAKLTTDLATKTTEHDSVKTQYDALVIEKESTIDELQANHAQVVLAKDADIAALQAKVAFLEGIRTYDPNIIKSESFYKRLSGDELFKLGVLALTDENAKGILGLLNAYLNNEWQVLLDDPQVVVAVSYLAKIGMLAEERVAEITRPASREEAYLV